MPIIEHAVQEALRNAGLVKNPEVEKEKSIEEMLDESGLTLSETVNHLSDVVTGADTSNTKLRAIETAFKLRGTLKDQAQAPPSINIIIHDGKFGAGTGNTINGLNPILIPRANRNVPTTPISLDA